MGRIVGQGLNDQPLIASGTTAQRPPSANSGALYYNTSKNILEVYNHKHLPLTNPMQQKEGHLNY